MNRARIGIVGTGWWATQFHIPGLLAYDAADVAALADPNEARLRAAAERFAHAMGMVFWLTGGRATEVSA